MPNNLIARHQAGLTPTMLLTATTLAVAALAALALGRMSDRVGRRPVAIGSSAALVVLAIPTSVVASRGSLVGLALAQVLIGIAVAGVLSVAMLGEAFPDTCAVHRRGLDRWHRDCVDRWNRAVDCPDSRQRDRRRDGTRRLRVGDWQLGPRGTVEMARDRLPESSVGPRSVRCPLDPAEQVGRRCTHRSDLHPFCMTTAAASGSEDRGAGSLHAAAIVSKRDTT